MKLLSLCVVLSDSVDVDKIEKNLVAQIPKDAVLHDVTRIMAEDQLSLYRKVLDSKEALERKPRTKTQLKLGV